MIVIIIVIVVVVVAVVSFGHMNDRIKRVVFFVILFEFTEFEFRDNNQRLELVLLATMTKKEARS